VRMTIFSWLGRELVALSGEGQPGLTAYEATLRLFEKAQEQLQRQGLSLDDTVRTRLFGQDRASRDSGGEARTEVLAGLARSASSSYIDPRRFETDALVAIDLLALGSSQGGADKYVCEYEPIRIPVRYVTRGGFVFLSGVTTTVGELSVQVPKILSDIEATLTLAGTDWTRAVRMSCYLQRSQTVSALKELLAGLATTIPSLEVELVDGYSSPGKLVEIEVTALE
jgi:enamine deaminase RidA (YjgF/YER057c/UK114 family)